MADNPPEQQAVIDELLGKAREQSGLKNTNEIAKAFSMVRHGTEEESQRYYSTVRKIESNASVSSWESVRDYLLACGIDIETLLRIAIAARRNQ